ncbi:hypothetical protein DL98DRAFT_599154 [Cadophora sp. DSE1049]|nr:hypothetical protein DL98DRAFT_599154 [Cadophora sp. DSE1049]
MSQIKQCTTMPQNDTEKSTSSTKAERDKVVLTRVDSKMDFSEHNDAGESSRKSTTTAQDDIEKPNTKAANKVALPRVDSKMSMSEASGIRELSLPAPPKKYTPPTTAFAISLSVLISGRPNPAGRIPKHPQREFRSAFKAFSERRQAELERDSDSITQLLTHSQKQSKIRQEFESSEENPVTLLPGAKSTLAYLQEQKIPFVLTTNYQYDTQELGEGGEAITDLRNILGVEELEARQLVQCPRVFRELVLRFRRKSVLVFSPGSESGAGFEDDEKVRDFAESLGFEDVYMPDDYYAVYPNLAPAGYKLPRQISSQARKLKLGMNQKGPCVEIKAVLVFGHPKPNERQNEDKTEGEEGYHMPTKFLIPILKSHAGDLRTESPFNGKKCLPNNGYQQAWAPKVWFDGVGLGVERGERLRREMEKVWWGETGREELRGCFVLGGEEEEKRKRCGDVLGGL